MQLFLILCVLISLICILPIFLLLCKEKIWGGKLVLSLVGLVLAFLELCVLRCTLLRVSAQGLLAILLNLPWVTHLGIILFLVAISVHVLGSEIEYRKHYFNSRSIREAMDNMPLGLCFGDLRGYPILTNRSMYRMAEELTGETFNNSKDFWLKIKRSKELNGNQKINIYATSEERIYTFAMKNGRIYQITKRNVEVYGKSFVQMIVSDITLQHELYQDTLSTNEELMEQRVEMRDLADRLIQSNHEEEILRYKIRIHNELGQQILATAKALSGEPTLEEYRQLADAWTDLANRFRHLDEEKQAKDRELLEEILSVADMIGCKLQIEQGFPEEVLRLPILRQAIREAIVNAVRHGHADAVEIGYTILPGKIDISIANNGELPTGEFHRKGGLKNLYEGIVGRGGQLSTECKDCFTLRITLPYTQGGEE